MNARRPKKKPSAALLGLAFDAEDGHKRITRGPNFLLAGGSSDTHGMMQETAVKLNEHLDSKGKRLADVSTNELRDILGDIHRKRLPYPIQKARGVQSPSFSSFRCFAVVQ